MIGLMKKPLAIYLVIRLKRNSLGPMGLQNKDMGTDLQTLLTELRIASVKHRLFTVHYFSVRPSRSKTLC